MSMITYTRIPSLTGGVKVRNTNGAVTHFGDLLAWSMFLEGAARRRANGVDITVFDEDGKCLVGDVGQLSGDAA